MTFHTNLITRLAVLLLLLGVVMTIGTPQVSAQTAIIPDANLKAALNAALNVQLGGNRQPADDILIATLSDSGFTRLDANGAGKENNAKITSLEGLDNADHLTYLNLSDNNLVDTVTVTSRTESGVTFNVRRDPTPASAKLSPLTNLVDLQVLDISNNGIASIAALRMMTKLRELRMQNNNIAEYDPIMNEALLPSVTEDGNGVRTWGQGVRPNGTVTGLPSGAQVWIGGNHYSEAFSTIFLPILIRVQGVTVYTAFGEAVSIPDESLNILLRHRALPLPPLGSSPSLKTQRAEQVFHTNEILTKRHLENITILDAYYLRQIGSHYLDITDLRGLEHCKNLEVLSLKGNHSLSNWIHLSKDPYSYVGQLTKLKRLDLSEQFDGFAEADSPSDLTPEEQGAYEPALKFLENLTELTHLDLSVNLIGNISPIVKLTKLEALDLRDNSISFLPLDFKNLTNLEVLYLSENLLEDRRDNWGVSFEYSPASKGYYDPAPGDSNYLMGSTLQVLASRPNKRLLTDLPIVKSVEFVGEPEIAYGEFGFVHIKVTFHTPMAYVHSKASYREGRPYIALGFDGGAPLLNPNTNPIHVADWIQTDSVIYRYVANPTERPPEPIDPRTGQPFTDADGDGIRDTDKYGNEVNALDYFRDLQKPLPAEAYVTLGKTVEFGYLIPPGFRYSDARVEWIASEFIYPVAEIDVINPSDPDAIKNVPDPFLAERALYGALEPTEGKAWRFGRSWFLSSPVGLEKPVIATNPTVELRRADGETGTVQGSFDVELAFSGPLSETSAAELANHISFGDVAGVSIESLSRPGTPTAYAPETWTLSVSAAGVNDDVTVTLDPNGLADVATPGNLVASEGSVLSVTVPVSTPSLVTPKTDGYAIGDALEMSILFTDDGVTYEGSTPPYITIYLGERVQANERHATWTRAEDVNSTLVTFAYEVAPGDVAQSVSIKSEAGIAVPRGATVTLGTERIVGNAPPPVESGEVPPATQPASGRPDPGVPAAGDSPLIGGASTVISLNTASVRVTATEIPVDIRGGIVWIPTEETEEKSGSSSVPRAPIVFNELGNGSGDTNDWLEFRNVTGSAVSLKDWTLSVVSDAKKEDKSLIAFPDVSVPANGLLLIVNTSPDKTLLARGDNIEGSAEKNGGSAQPYLVNAGLSLPDDGKFLLILRNAKDKLGKNEAFVDVAGGGGSDTDAFIREQTGDYDTHVWPLQVREAPGANTEGALGSGKVYQRAKADVVGYHKDAWAEAAFTGLGYDRKVTQSAATAGTPGYPNGALKTGSDTPKGSITFSEIMVDSGGGKLPQWIELYNRSKTEAININRWQLEIQNVDSEDLIGRPIVTLTLQKKIIQPNQTLLIVSGDARASSAARLPADRVYNLFKLHEKNLRIKNPRDTFLSAEGFYLKLTDSNGTKIDEIGNTDGNRRTNDAPVWALAMSAEEGVRSSLIRRYTDGKSEAKNGMLSGNWVLAAHVKRFVAGSEDFHWGHADDIGTPGYRKGGPLPVELSSFSVKRTEKGAVVLTWTTESEVDNAGFNLRRSEKRASGFTLINPALIAGAGTTGERQTYTFTDTSAKPGVEYYYQIEEVSFAGRPSTLVTRMLPGPVSASNRALTTFGELKAKE